MPRVAFSASSCARTPSSAVDYMIVFPVVHCNDECQRDGVGERGQWGRMSLASGTATFSKQR